MAPITSAPSIRTAAGFVLHAPNGAYTDDREWRDLNSDMVLLRFTNPLFLFSGIFEPVSRPGERLEYRPHSLVSEALLEASLDCHYWKIFLMETLSRIAVSHGAPSA